MATDQCLRVGTLPASDRLDLGHRLAVTCDGVALPGVLDGVQEIGEPTSGLCGGDLGHGNQII